MFAVNQDDGLDRRHAELVIRELAKFHAISFCMKYGSNDRLLDAYPYLQVASFMWMMSFMVSLFFVNSSLITTIIELNRDQVWKKYVMLHAIRYLNLNFVICGDKFSVFHIN